MSNSELLPGLGLFFGVLQFNKRPQILWSGSTWHSDYLAWDLLLKILDVKDRETLEKVGWNFLPLIWDEIEIFALTKLFQVTGVGSAYLVIFHESAEILTQFLLNEESQLTETFKTIFTTYFPSSTQGLSNEQLKQIRIKSQEYYEILSQLK